MARASTSERADRFPDDPLKVARPDISFAEPRPGFLRGKDDANRIEDVVFAGLNIAGRPVSSPQEAGIQINSHTRNVRPRARLGLRG